MNKNWFNTIIYQTEQLQKMENCDFISKKSTKIHVYSVLVLS